MVVCQQVRSPSDRLGGPEDRCGSALSSLLSALRRDVHILHMMVTEARVLPTVPP